MAALTAAATVAAGVSYQAHSAAARKENTVQPKDSKSRKCPGCGSFEYRYHNMVRICSYCRTGQ